MYCMAVTSDILKIFQILKHAIQPTCQLHIPSQIWKIVSKAFAHDPEDRCTLDELGGELNIFFTDARSAENIAKTDVFPPTDSSDYSHLDPTYAVSHFRHMQMTTYKQI